MQLPNFLIIGTHKAGTSSLYVYLKEHPDVYMSPLKEPRFFAYNPDNPDHHTAKSLPIKRMEDYLKLFNGVSREKAVGEASPNYLHSRTAAKNIRTHIPHAKLIVSLRNPVDKTISLHGMLYRQDKERRSLDEALWTDERLLHGGRYYDDLRHYMELFGKDQVKVLLFEDLKSDALGVMKDLYRYLEVDEHFCPDVSVRYNAATDTRWKTMRQIKKMYYGNVGLQRTVQSLLPDGLRRRIGQIGAQEIKTGTRTSDDTRHRLTEYYRDDILKLQDLIDRDLSAWLKSHPRTRPETRVSANTIYG